MRLESGQPGLWMVSGGLWMTVAGTVVTVDSMTYAKTDDV